MKTIDLLDKNKIEILEELIIEFWHRNIDMVVITTLAGNNSQKWDKLNIEANWLVSLLSDFLEENKEAVTKLKQQ